MCSDGSSIASAAQGFGGQQPNMGATGQVSVYNATLKGKINGLEETAKALSEEINFYHNEIMNLRDEKNMLEQQLAQKMSEIREQLTQDVCK